MQCGVDVHSKVAAQNVPAPPPPGSFGSTTDAIPDVDPDPAGESAGDLFSVPDDSIPAADSGGDLFDDAGTSDSSTDLFDSGSSTDPSTNDAGDAFDLDAPLDDDATSPSFNESIDTLDDGSAETSSDTDTGRAGSDDVFDFGSSDDA